MIQAKLLIGETEDQRSNYIAVELASSKITAADTVTLEVADEKELIGISQVRDFTRQMILSPVTSPFRAGMISNAHLLTIEAQNALLKIIEEPPKNSVFFLGSPTPDAVLPTVVSRCHVIYVSEKTATMSDSQIAPNTQLETLMTATPGVILDTMQSVAQDRNAAKQWTLSAIHTMRDLLVTEVKSDKNPRRLDRLVRTILVLERARKELSANVTPRLVLEQAFLSLGK